LTGLWICKSTIIGHVKDKIGGNGKACSLCQIDTSNKRKTKTMCRTCQVPLRTTVLLNQTSTCFQRWHSCHDLIITQEEQCIAL
jgi:hypothetical protein